MVYLPFADDIRHPESDPSFTGPEPHPSAREEQVSISHHVSICYCTPHKQDTIWPEDFVWRRICTPDDYSGCAAQVEAARRLLDKLQLPNFSVGQAPNPHLQRHYQVSSMTAAATELRRFTAAPNNCFPVQMS